MNCHIVPRSYLKAWKIPTTNNSIYVFDKNETRAINNNKNIDNLSDTNFAIEDKYLIDIFNKNYMYKFYADFSEIVNELNVTVTYNDIKIISFTEYVDHLDCFEDWIYTTKDGVIIENTVVCDLFTKKISEIIEKYFANNIENSWPVIKEYVTTIIMNNRGTVSAEHKEILIEFTVVQLLRRFENMQAMGLSNVIAMMNKVFGENIFDSFYEESLWLMQLYGYAIQKSSNSLIRSIQHILDNYQPCFLISTGSLDFITSDNPCYNIEKTPYPFESGIYLPISPKVCLFLCNLTSYVDKTKYYIFEINDNNVKNINSKTKKYAIKNLAYHSDDISNLICDNIDKDNWNVIPNTLFNELFNK